VEVELHALTSDLKGETWSALHSCCLTSRETDPGAAVVGGWLGHRSPFGLFRQDQYFLVLLGIESRTLGPLAHSSDNYADFRFTHVAAA
jgi:hypothetical protein